MTIGEIDLVLEVGLEEFNDSLRRHVDLKVSILNTAAPYTVKPKDGKLHQMSDYLPDSLKPQKQELSEEDQARRISEAGRKLAAKCDRYRRR